MHDQSCHPSLRDTPALDGHHPSNRDLHHTPQPIRFPTLRLRDSGLGTRHSQKALSAQSILDLRPRFLGTVIWRGFRTAEIDQVRALANDGLRRYRASGLYCPPRHPIIGSDTVAAIATATTRWHACLRSTRRGAHGDDQESWTPAPRSQGRLCRNQVSRPTSERA